LDCYQSALQAHVVAWQSIGRPARNDFCESASSRLKATRAGAAELLSSGCPVTAKIEHWIPSFDQVLKQTKHRVTGETPVTAWRLSLQCPVTCLSSALPVTSPVPRALCAAWVGSMCLLPASGLVSPAFAHPATGRPVLSPLSPGAAHHRGGRRAVEAGPVFEIYRKKVVYTTLI
jgi:hypothetical protein